jgi:membrane glycosyltransferase
MLVLDVRTMEGSTIVELARRMDRTPRADPNGASSLPDEPCFRACSSFQPRLRVRSQPASPGEAPRAATGATTDLRISAFTGPPACPPDGRPPSRHPQPRFRRGGADPPQLKIIIATTLAGLREGPPTIADFLATRDRRWCQGNLQHARLIATPAFTG